MYDNDDNNYGKHNPAWEDYCSCGADLLLKYILIIDLCGCNIQLNPYDGGGMSTN